VPIDLTPKKVHRLVGAAFRGACDDARVSIRGAAVLMGCAESTAQRLAENGCTILPLRSRKLALPFLDRLRAAVLSRNHVGGR
jgi:hypothetical protein